jgi:hypothetical protein
MKPRKFFLAPLIFAFVLASCAQNNAQPLPPAVVEPSQTATQTASVAQPQATEPPAQVVVPAAATSRGDQLEATDPATVSLASGGIQLVEIFRFT